MKKAIVVAVSIFLFSSLSVFAQTIDITESAAPTSAMSKKVRYELPYPGILPDSPLYFLKAARDRVISLLISDPLKKAEFNLLQADKRVNSGVYLVNKNKDELGISTISKGINYFDEALERLSVAGDEGSDIKPLSERMYAASQKYEEVIDEIYEDIDALQKEQLNFEKKRILQYKMRAKDMMKAKK